MNIYVCLWANLRARKSRGYPWVPPALVRLSDLPTGPFLGPCPSSPFRCPSALRGAGAKGCLGLTLQLVASRFIMSFDADDPPTPASEPFDHGAIPIIGGLQSPDRFLNRLEVSSDSVRHFLLDCPRHTLIVGNQSQPIHQCLIDSIPVDAPGDVDSDVLRRYLAHSPPRRAWSTVRAAPGRSAAKSALPHRQQVSPSWEWHVQWYPSAHHCVVRSPWTGYVARGVNGPDRIHLIKAFKILRKLPARGVTPARFRAQPGSIRTFHRSCPFGEYGASGGGARTREARAELTSSGLLAIGSSGHLTAQPQHTAPIATPISSQVHHGQAVTANPEGR
jgi:hypothetical protein